MSAFTLVVGDRPHPAIFCLPRAFALRLPDLDALSTELTAYGVGGGKVTLDARPRAFGQSLEDKRVAWLAVYVRGWRRIVHSRTTLARAELLLLLVLLLCRPARRWRTAVAVSPRLGRRSIAMIGPRAVIVIIVAIRCAAAAARAVAVALLEIILSAPVRTLAAAARSVALPIAVALPVIVATPIIIRSPVIVAPLVIVAPPVIIAPRPVIIATQPVIVALLVIVASPVITTVVVTPIGIVAPILIAAIVGAPVMHITWVALVI